MGDGEARGGVLGARVLGGGVGYSAAVGERVGCLLRGGDCGGGEGSGDTDAEVEGEGWRVECGGGDGEGGESVGCEGEGGEG